MSPPKRASSGGGRGAGPVATRGRRRLHEKQRPRRAKLFVPQAQRQSPSLSGGAGGTPPVAMTLERAARPAAAARPTARRSPRRSRPSRSFPTAGAGGRATAGPRPPEGTSSPRRAFSGLQDVLEPREDLALGAVGGGRHAPRREARRRQVAGPGRRLDDAPESRVPRERRRDHLCVARRRCDVAPYAIDTRSLNGKDPQTRPLRTQWGSGCTSSRRGARRSPAARFRGSGSPAAGRAGPSRAARPRCG